MYTNSLIEARRFHIVNNPVPVFCPRVIDDNTLLWGLMYTDTVRIRIREEVNLARIKGQGWRHNLNEDYRTGYGHHGYYKDYTAQTGAMIKAGYHLCDYTKQPNLWVEFSVQKVANGNNHTIIPQTVQLSVLQQEIKSICDGLNITCPDIREWNLVRIDFARNFLAGDDVNDYIAVLATRKMKYGRDRHTHCNGGRKKALEEDTDKLDNGVGFKNDSVKTIVYNKNKQAGLVGQPGILRIETSAWTCHKIQDWFGKNDVRFGEISQEIALKVLRADMHELGLDVPIHVVGTVTEVMTKLYEKNAYLYKCLVAEKEQNPFLTDDELAQRIGRAVGWVKDAFRKMKKDGINFSTLIQRDLPALILAEFGGGEYRTKILSNTSVTQTSSVIATTDSIKTDAANGEEHLNKSVDLGCVDDEKLAGVEPTVNHNKDQFVLKLVCDAMDTEHAQKNYGHVSFWGGIMNKLIKGKRSPNERSKPVDNAVSGGELSPHESSLSPYETKNIHMKIHRIIQQMVLMPKKFGSVRCQGSWPAWRRLYLRPRLHAY